MRYKYSNCSSKGRQSGCASRTPAFSKSDDATHERCGIQTKRKEAALDTVATLCSVSSFSRTALAGHLVPTHFRIESLPTRGGAISIAVPGVPSSQKEHPVPVSISASFRQGNWQGRYGVLSTASFLTRLCCRTVLYVYCRHPQDTRLTKPFETRQGSLSM